MSFCLYSKKNITRRLEEMNFIFSWQKKKFYSLVALVRKILFCHSKIKFISSRHRVISSLYIFNQRSNAGPFPYKYTTSQTSPCYTLENYDCHYILYYIYNKWHLPFTKILT